MSGGLELDFDESLLPNCLWEYFQEVNGKRKETTDLINSDCDTTCIV